jgi:hypothetical protein
MRAVDFRKLLKLDFHSEFAQFKHIHSMLQPDVKVLTAALRRVRT